MSEEIRTAHSGMFALPKRTKAWYICRNLELVDCTHASEDGRFYLIDLPDGAKSYRADADCIHLTNEDALETLTLLADYWSQKATFMRGVMRSERAKQTEKHFINNNETL